MDMMTIVDNWQADRCVKRNVDSNIQTGIVCVKQSID